MVLGHRRIPPDLETRLLHKLQMIDDATPRALVRQQPEFWLNVQRRSDQREAMNNPRERERIERAKPLVAAA